MATGIELDTEFIDWRIEDLGLSANKVAKRMKVAPSTVSRWLSGNRGIEWDDVRRLARALELPPHRYSMLVVASEVAA